MFNIVKDYDSSLTIYNLKENKKELGKDWIDLKDITDNDQEDAFY